MKLNNIVRVGFVAAVALVSAVNANAAMSEVASRTDSVMIGTEATPVNLTLTPLPQQAGDIKDYARLVSVAAIPPQPTDMVVFRWVPGSGVLGNKAYIITYPGTNNQNHLVVDLESCVDTDPAHSTHDPDWFFAKDPGSVNCFITVEGDQHVAADTYTVYLEAGVWQA